ncbi:hypothetical protein OWV82_006340 [Melia azedarach]|uniref:Uncharacterized protein n=1 Tax=Melia azedarach TaxID=155640 RepID=A0ACC1YIQ9_MELAZ|nr:hypothetical protein OWV82_006340 [Melia azedarach]
MADEKDRLCICIEEKLDLVPTQFSDCSIAKVPQHLRNVNEKAYEPQLIAIGPYHRRRTHLEAMEEQKLRYLKLLLLRRKESNLTRYAKAMRELEEKARACYAEIVFLKTDEFVEMLILDACFIVELFRRCEMSELNDNNDPDFYKDPVFNTFWIKKKLGRDLLLVENQLPFFVLQKFFNMTVMPKERNNFLQMIFAFFVPLLPNRRCVQRVRYSVHDIKHLLSFIHDHWVSSIKTSVSDNEEKKSMKYWNRWNLQMSKTKRRMRHKIFAINKVDDWEFMRCATELKESGIKFMRLKGDSLFDVKFENGIMKIPRLRIEDDTESFFRNLIVYEQFYPETSDPVIDYMKFMDCLVNSAKDVELLCQRKILHHSLGDDEAVASMFNRLGDSVTLSSSSHYRKIFKDVNKHCSRRRKKWMANLRHNYFNTPWALISFLAAVLLVLLTLAQTVFSVLSYFQ